MFSLLFRHLGKTASSYRLISLLDASLNLLYTYDLPSNRIFLSLSLEDPSTRKILALGTQPRPQGEKRPGDEVARDKPLHVNRIQKTYGDRTIRLLGSSWRGKGLSKISAPSAFTLFQSTNWNPKHLTCCITRVPLMWNLKYILRSIITPKICNFSESLKVLAQTCSNIYFCNSIVIYFIYCKLPLISSKAHKTS